MSDGAIGEGSNSAKGIVAHDMGDDASSTDYSVSVDIDANTGNTYNNGVGLVFGYEDANNYFKASWDDYSTSYDTGGRYPNPDGHKDFTLIKVENGVETTLDMVDRAELGDNFNLSVTVDENGISVSVDGAEMLTSSTEQPELGTIGLWTFDNDGGVNYDNVSVTADTAGQEIRFTPEANYNGEASFDYTVSDGNGGTDTATVTLNVTSDGIDEIASAPTLEMSIGDAVVTESSTTTTDVQTPTAPDMSGATNVGEGSGTWDQVSGTSGDDTIEAGDNYDKVALGDGNDTLNIGDAASGWTKIDAGKGDDTMTVGSGFDVIDGGKGEDTVVFKGDESEWTVGERGGNTTVTNNATGEMTTLKNVENIEFGGEDASATGATTYEYPITLNAGLTDTDGSETLSAIIVDNIPDGAILKDSDGSEISTNEDGSYTVETNDNGEAHVILESDSEISQDELNGVTASVTSTEESTGDTSTISMTDDGELSFLDDVDAIDFNDIVSESSDIHTINMENETTQELTIDADDLIIANGDHEMVILGDDGDEIDLEGEGWTKQAENVEIDGEDGTFDTYVNTADGINVSVNVDVEISVNDELF